MEQIINFITQKQNIPEVITDYHDVIIVSVDNNITCSAPVYIGSLLLKLNYNPKIIQHLDHSTYEHQMEIIDKFFVNENQILGISLTFCRDPWQKKKIAEFVKYVRDKFPKLTIIAGGANNMFDFNVFPDDVIKLMGQNREDEILS